MCSVAIVIDFTVLIQIFIYDITRMQFAPRLETTAVIHCIQFIRFCLIIYKVIDYIYKMFS